MCQSVYVISIIPMPYSWYWLSDAEGVIKYTNLSIISSTLFRHVPAMYPQGHHVRLSLWELRASMQVNFRRAKFWSLFWSPSYPGVLPILGLGFSVIASAFGERRRLGSSNIDWWVCDQSSNSLGFKCFQSTSSCSLPSELYSLCVRVSFSFPSILTLWSFSILVVDFFSHRGHCQHITESWRAWSGFASSHSDSWSCRRKCPFMLVFLDSLPPIFIQMGAPRSGPTVRAPPAVASYVGGMDSGCCYWFTERAPEHFISMQW